MKKILGILCCLFLVGCSTQTINNNESLFNYNLVRAMQGEKWGFINPSGDWVIEATYDEVGNFDNQSSIGRAHV